MWSKGGGRSALMWAAYRGDTAILKVLVDAGADVNAEGNLGTPLSQAAWANRTEAARLLRVSFRSMRYRLSKLGITGIDTSGGVSTEIA